MDRPFIELTPLPAVQVSPDTVVLTRKFLEGMERYASLWPGPVEALMHPVEEATSNLDPVEVRPQRLPFRLSLVPYDAPELRARIRRAGLVHWGPHHPLSDVGDVLAEAGVPGVYVTEYSLRTRRQIIDATTPNPLRRWRRKLWASRQERRIRRDISRASGFEANGTPTFDAYRELNPHRLLFFDSRTTADHLIAPAELERRLARAADPARPLHLVFSGRLIEMKGTLDLIDVAAELRRRGVPFRMSICGGGALEGAMRARAAKEGLEAALRFRGVLDFARELLPFFKAEADVFVCCHRQGDPSCTYLETFACGVPIAGYRNEAFDGLLRRVDAGWGAPMGNATALAALLEDLHRHREGLAAKSRAALAFASENTFERTFSHRVAFFRATAARGARRN